MLPSGSKLVKALPQPRRRQRTQLDGLGEGEAGTLKGETCMAPNYTHEQITALREIAEGKRVAGPQDIQLIADLLVGTIESLEREDDYQREMSEYD